MFDDTINKEGKYILDKDPIVKNIENIIENKTKDIYDLVEDGSFGNELLLELQENPSEYFNKIYIETSNNEWLRWVQKYPGLASLYKAYPPIEKALNKLGLTNTNTQNVSTNTKKTSKKKESITQPDVLVKTKDTEEERFYSSHEYEINRRVYKEIDDITNDKSKINEKKAYNNNHSLFVLEKIKQYEKEYFENLNSLDLPEKLKQKIGIQNEIDYETNKEIDSRKRGGVLGKYFSKKSSADDWLKVRKQKEEEFWNKWKALSKEEKGQYTYNSHFIIHHSTLDEMRAMGKRNVFNRNSAPAQIYQETYRKQEELFWNNWKTDEKDSSIYENPYDDLAVQYTQRRLEIELAEEMERIKNTKRNIVEKIKYNRDPLKEYIPKVEEKEAQIWKEFNLKYPEKAAKYKDFIAGLKQVYKPEKIVIKFSSSGYINPLTNEKTKKIASAIDAASGFPKKTDVPDKSVQEAARNLWRHGANPDKLENAIKASSVNLNQKDKENLLNIVKELRKLNNAYPDTSKTFRQQLTDDSIEITKTFSEYPTVDKNTLVLEKLKRGLQVAPSEKEEFFYGQQYIDESVASLDKLSDYAKIFDEQEEPSDYKEPEFEFPEIPEEQPTYTPPKVSSKPMSDVFSKASQDVKNAVSNATSNLKGAAESQAKQLAKKGLTNLAKSVGPALAQAGGYLAAAGAILMGFVGWLIAIIITVVVWSVSLIVFVALVLFIINSGAYMVPPGENLSQYGSSAPIPPGGTVGNCGGAGGTVDITQDLANRIDNGNVQLLPPDSGARPLNLCFTPLMVILHSSAGYDNNQGNDAVYNTLAPPERQASCNMASDTNDVILMQPFYEATVEMSWCSNSWNDMGISIEISGECQDSDYPCKRNNSNCQVGADSYPYIFQPPGSSPTHPCPDENDLTFSAVCEVMKQYNIPWCQVYTHDDVPNQGHTDPVGKAWVYDYFIPRLKKDCQVPANSQCR